MNTKKKREKVKSHPRTWGHDDTLNSTVVPPEIQSGNYRTRDKGQKKGGCRAREGERKGAGSRHVTSLKGPKGLRESQPEVRSYRFSSTPTHHQHCPPNITGGLQRQ